MSAWRRTKEYRNWKKEVLRTYNYMCPMTGETENLHAHHKNHATYFPEERFLVSNGVPLPSDMHIAIHCDFKQSYRHKCTEKDYKEFGKLYGRIRKRVKLEQN